MWNTRAQGIEHGLVVAGSVVVTWGERICIVIVDIPQKTGFLEPLELHLRDSLEMVDHSVVNSMQRLCAVAVEVPPDKAPWISRITLGGWSWNARLSVVTQVGNDYMVTVEISLDTEFFELVQLYPGDGLEIADLSGVILREETAY